MSEMTRVRTMRKIMAHQIEFLENKFPNLRGLDLPVSDATQQVVFQIYCEHVKLQDESARRVALTEFFRHLSERPGDVQAAAKKNLARLYLERGLLDHAARLYNGEAGSLAEIGAAQKEHDEHYGCRLNDFPKSERSRGMCLVHYLAAHPDLIKGKSVLHIGPEPELWQFFDVNAAKLGGSYKAIDGTRPGQVEHHDLCAMDLPDESFDFIICHRVLEHIMDEASALKEIHRVLKPGGVFNMSVPEALYLERTADWVIPDDAVHGHVRTYGRDLPARLAAAGFNVEREDWLVQKPFDELAKLQAYPLLMYNAAKV